MDQLLKTLGIVLNATLMYTPPLLFAALGSCCSEKSGVPVILGWRSFARALRAWFLR